MAQWFTIHAASDRITGHQRSKGDVPADTAEALYRDSTGLMDTVQGLREQARAEGRRPVILWNNGTPVLDQDNRPKFSVTADRNVLAANGVDEVQLTVTKLRANGVDTHTNFDGPRIVQLIGDRYVRLVFASGVATKQWATTQNGAHDIRSTDEYDIVNGPLTLTAVD